MTDYRTLSADDIPDTDAPPTPEETGTYTISTVAWHLDQCTTDGWTIEKCGFRQPAPVKTHCLKATLVHDRSATLRCKPIDPFQSRTGPDVYRAHRLKATGSHDRLPAYITLEHSVPDTGGRFEHFPPDEPVLEHVAEDPTEYLNFHSLRQVRQVDSKLQDGYYGRGHSIEEVPAVEYTLALAAHWLESRFQQRETFGSLVADPPDVAPD